MKASIRRSIALVSVFILTSIISQTVFAQSTVTMTVTVDNEVNVYLSTDDAVLGTLVLGPGTEWTLTDTAIPNLTAGVTNYIHVVGINSGGPAMFIGEFTLNDTLFEFANGTQSLLTNTTEWQVSATDFSAPAYMVPSDLGPNDGTNATWGAGFVDSGNIDAAARFIWHPAGDTTTPAYFSAAILPTDADIGITSVENSADPVIAGSGADNLDYTFTVTNNGPGDATNVIIDWALATTIPLAGYNCGVTPSQGAIVGNTWEVGSLADSAAATLDVLCTINSAAPAGSTLSWTLTLNSLDQIDPNADNDSAAEDSTVTREVNFDVTASYAEGGAGEVNLTLTCNSVVVDTATTVGLQATLTVTDFADATACDVTQEIIGGLFPTYSAGCSVPDIASGTTYTCDITNAVTNASFLVTKAYSDGNTDDVDVTLTCNNGLPLQQTFTISEGSSVKFVITTFDEGEMDCEISETGTADGYTPSYDNGTVISADSCEYIDVTSTAYTCAISNAADDATFTVYKEWEIINEGGEGVNEIAFVTIFCNNPIQGGFWNGIEYALNGTLEGDGDSLTATVDTTLASAQCRAEESVSQSGVETEDNCGTRTIPAGGSSECTISNTVFFEGIPTLSQYGLAIMALLMLGVGFVGFRRMI